MAYSEKNTMWFFVRSLLAMAVVLLPFFYIGKALLNQQFTTPWTHYLVDTIFGPTVWFFDAVCASMGYCIVVEYTGAAVMVPIYIVSVILYSYIVSLIWRWVSIMPNSDRRHLVEYDEHDDIF